MMAATVGMAIGQNSDVTAEAAGVVVMDNSLEKVDEFMHISRRMRSIALQSAVGGMALSIDRHGLRRDRSFESGGRRHKPGNHRCCWPCSMPFGLPFLRASFMTSEAWHSRSANEVLAHFGSSVSGLSATDASARLAADGPNELTEGTRIGPLKILLGQFKSLSLLRHASVMCVWAVAQRLFRECQ